MKALKGIVLLLSIILITPFVFVSVVDAATALPGANINTLNSSGYTQYLATGIIQSVTQFDLGETVYMLLTGVGAGLTADISLIDIQTGVTIKTWPNQLNNAVVSYGGSGDTVLAPGYYGVYVNCKFGLAIAYATILVVPENIFGAIGATVVAFAAFGSLVIIKRKHI